VPRKLHDPGRLVGKSKSSKVPGPPGRVGSRDDVPPGRGVDETQSEEGCIYIRGDGPEMAAEVEYQWRAQTGTTSGAGKRLAGTGMGTRFGLPLDEPRHGELKYVEHEPIEGDVYAAPDAKVGERRKTEVTE